MSIIETIFVFLVILSILVVVHEWGHFIVARLCGIRVDEFSLGFGPLAWNIGKRGDTEYNVRWIPLGGFVKIAGMEADEEPILNAAEKVKSLAGSPKANDDINATTVPLVAENTPNLAETKEQRERDDQEGFYAHPIWQRSLVIFAGPFMSFVLGYVIIFGTIWAIGIPDKILNKVDQVTPGSEAQRIGLKSGDEITSLNGKPVSDGDDMITVIHSSLGKQITLTVLENGQTRTLTATPRPTQGPDGKTVGILGFKPEEHVHHVPIVVAFDATNSAVVEWSRLVGGLFRRHNIAEIRKSAGGPIFMAQMTKQAVNAGGPNVPLLAANLTMSLALFNLLPIPILDGGHLLVFFIEACRRGRRLTMEQQQNFMLAGLAVIGVLFVLIMFNDILRTIHPTGP